MTRGDVVIERAVAEPPDVALDKLTDAGADGGGAARRLPGARWTGGRAASTSSRCRTRASRPTCSRWRSRWPRSPTGTALITENVFEGRFMFVNELVRLGADVRIDGHHAVVRGRERLSSAPVVATDIRAGAGLVLAGLVADGVTEVQDVHHIDRGYPDFVEQLRGLGAEVERTQRPG